jgi:hypothetical protein
LNAPFVARYRKSTTVFTEQSLLQPIVGLVESPGVWNTRMPMPAWLSTSGKPRPSCVCVLQTNGCCCGPEKIGPVVGWFTSVSSAVGRPMP